MTILESLILGAIQGITEFLPISSSAHLVLTRFFFNWHDPGLAYDVALHMGTLAAILMFFWKDWLEIIRDIVRHSGTRHPINLKLLVIASIPGAVAGLALEDVVETAFRSPLLIAGTLTVFGLLLWYFDSRGRKDRELMTVGMKDALIVGAAQALAIIPGVSRSGITITAGLLLGLGRNSAVRFSFLLSAPIIAGAGLVKGKYILEAMTTDTAQAMLVASGFLASVVSGFLALGFLSYIVKSRTFIGFVAYRLALALAIVVFVIFR